MMSLNGSLVLVCHNNQWHKRAYRTSHYEFKVNGLWNKRWFFSGKVSVNVYGGCQHSLDKVHRDSLSHHLSDACRCRRF